VGGEGSVVVEAREDAEAFSCSEGDVDYKAFKGEEEEAGSRFCRGVGDLSGWGWVFGGGGGGFGVLEEEA
jgi:hypothetical protein